MGLTPARILIPVDFTRPSATALEAGYALASELGASVHVLHVTAVPPFVEPGLAVRLVTQRSTTTIEALALAAAEKGLDQLMADHPPPAALHVTRQVQYGLPLERIEVASRDFDLVVVGTHGRTGLDHLFIGSVAERVVRHVDRPVLVARDLTKGVRTVLVPVDFSDASRAAYRHGAALARELGATLRVLHVIPLMPALENAELMVVGSSDEPMVSLHDYARWRAQEDLWRFLSSVGSTRDTAAVDVRIGDPADEIIECARAQESDLVVMGTHGRTEWAWVGVGSVAERVVRHAPCSVLTTRWTATERRAPEHKIGEPEGLTVVAPGQKDPRPNPE